MLDQPSRSQQTFNDLAPIFSSLHKLKNKHLGKLNKIRQIR